MTEHTAEVKKSSIARILCSRINCHKFEANAAADIANVDTAQTFDVFNEALTDAHKSSESCSLALLKALPYSLLD